MSTRFSRAAYSLTDPSEPSCSGGFVGDELMDWLSEVSI